MASCCVSSLIFVSACEIRTLKRKLWIRRININRRKTKFAVEYTPTKLAKVSNIIGKILTIRRTPAKQTQKTESSILIWDFRTRRTIKISVNKEAAIRTTRNIRVISNPLSFCEKTEWKESRSPFVSYRQSMSKDWDNFLLRCDPSFVQGSRSPLRLLA